MSRHILHIFPQFNVGGPQVRFITLAAGLGDRFTHTVVSMSGNYAASEMLPPGLNVRLADKDAPIRGGLAARLAGYRREIERLSPDLLVTYNWGSIEWALANAASGAPHVHFEDGFGPEESSRQLLRRVWTRRLALRRSQVVVPSTTLRDLATKVWRLDPARVRFIPNGIEPRDGHKTCIEALGLDLPQGLPRIVWAGAMRPEKNLPRLLHAFARLRDEAVLIVIGDGPQRQEVEAEVDKLGLRPHVRFLGFRPDARDIIMQCQVMALSSDTEQMPIAVLEAMDAGLPVASSAVGDVARMVAPDNLPFIVAPSDESLSQAMASLVRDGALRAAIGRANRQHMRDTYRLDDMIGAYGDFFEDASAASAARHG